MASLKRLVSALLLLSLLPSFAASQDKSDAYLDEQIQKRMDEIEKNMKEIRELIKLRHLEPRAITKQGLGVSGKPSKVELPYPYTTAFEISGIEPGSDAEAMGLKVEDIVLTDLPQAPNVDDLVNVVDALNSQGTKFPRIVFLRDGKLYFTSRIRIQKK